MILTTLSSVVCFVLLVTTCKTETVTATWLLNTFSGNPNWVETNINDLWVAHDGSVYTTTIWDEGGRPGSIWKDGQYVGMLQLNQNQFGGLAVTGYYDTKLNENVIFSANGGPSQNGGGNPTDKLFKFHANGTPFNYEGSNSNTFNPSNNAKTTVYGLAANSQVLVVSDPNNNRIIIYDSSTGSFKSQFTFQRPADIAIDSSSNLWIVQASYSFAGYPIPYPNKYYGPSTIQKWSLSGQYLNVNITDLVEPSAVNIQYLQNGVERLLIADFGPSQQVSGYIGLNISGNVHLDTSFQNNGKFGVSAYDKNGDLTQTPQALYLLNNVGGDSAGNIYTNCGGPYPRGDDTSAGTDLRSFDSNGKNNWWIYGEAFVIMGDVDPADPTMFYTGHDLWKYDSSTDKWIFQAITHNKFKYPEDSRVLLPGVFYPQEVPQNVFARRLSNGELYLFMNFMAGDQGSVKIFRFNQTSDGYIAIPSARWDVADGRPYPPNAPGKGIEYVWHDANGNGKHDAGEYITDPVQEEPYKDGTWPDKDGNLWTGYRNHGIRRLKLASFDSYKNPVYTFTPREWFNPPQPITDVHYIRYNVTTDTMYIAGQTEDNKADHDTAYGIWSITRYDNWLNKTSQLTMKWTTPSQYYMTLDNSSCWDIHNEYIFTVGLKNNHLINVWNTNDGSHVTTLNVPSWIGNSQNMGWVDIWDSGLRAGQFANGTYMIFVEEDLRNKIVQYAFTP